LVCFCSLSEVSREAALDKLASAIKFDGVKNCAEDAEAPTTKGFGPSHVFARCLI
jgi:hypothetical protein